MLNDYINTDVDYSIEEFVILVQSLAELFDLKYARNVLHTISLYASTPVEINDSDGACKD